MTRNSLTVFLFLVIFFSGVSLLYSEEKALNRFRIAAKTGYNFIVDSGLSDYTNDGISIGGALGFMITEDIEISGEMNFFESENRLLGIDCFNVSHFLTGAYFHLYEGGVFEVKLGGGVDFGRVKYMLVVENSVEIIDNNAGVWVGAGFDVMVSINFTVGVEARYIFLSVDNRNYGGVQVLGVLGIRL